MTETAVIVSFAAFASAFVGGILALRAARAVGLIIAFGAGIRIGAAYFDLIPESIDSLGGNLELAMIFLAFGFLAFYAIEKLTNVHVGHEAAAELDHELAEHHHVGLLGAIGMSLHSFLDGVALAAALAVGGGFGLVIAAVVVIHRFSDGIAVVSLLLAARTNPRDAYRWVAIVAVAPVVGVIVGVLLPISGQVLGALLATFAGFFLYIGAAELLPEAHRSDRSRWVVFATVAGVVSIWAFSVATGAIGVAI
ncbi:MAG TPA: ZIP family metal transporter [Candidatus Polarisedimenticolia bacterium]|nr:ZIP family metal transporter [Candidatus Polarisedimenticolia bacterium]